MNREEIIEQLRRIEREVKDLMDLNKQLKELLKK